MQLTVTAGAASAAAAATTHSALIGETLRMIFGGAVIAAVLQFVNTRRSERRKDQLEPTQMVVASAETLAQVAQTLVGPLEHRLSLVQEQLTLAEEVARADRQAAAQRETDLLAEIHTLRRKVDTLTAVIRRNGLSVPDLLEGTG